VKKYAYAFEERFSRMREIKVLPDLPAAGAYFSKLLKTDDDYEKLPEPGIDAIFLTHAHYDHHGNIPFLSPKIPLYGTPETLCFYRQSWINSYIGSDGFLRNLYVNNEHFRQEKVGLREIAHDAAVAVKGTKVTALRVDHSIPGACGFLVETSGGKKIAITGDFRMHGAMERRDLTLSFIKAVKDRGPSDLLIAEGTNIDEYSSEAEEAESGWSVKKFILTEASLAFERGAMVVVGVSGNNIERIDSIYEVAKELGAKLHMSVYNASLLEKLRATGAFAAPDHVVNNLKDNDAVVIYERYGGEFAKKFGGDAGAGYARHKVEDYGGAAGAALKEKAIMLLYEGDIPLLSAIKPAAGSKYIRSSWEPFNDEQVTDHKRLRNWLNLFGLTYHHIHASGHIYGPQLKEAIREMSPKLLAPVHTLQPALFNDILGPARLRLVKNGSDLQI